MIDRTMCQTDALVLMAVEAMDGAGGVTADYILHRRAYRGDRVDIPGGVVTGGAGVHMGTQDIRPVLHRVAGGAGLRIDLTEVGGRINCDGMVNQATGGTMVMAGEVGGVAVDALAGAVQGRSFASTGGRAVTGGATLGGMDLARSDKR